MRLRHRIPLLIALVACCATVVAPAAASGPSNMTWSPVPASSRKHALHSSQSNGTPTGTIRIPSIGVEEQIRSGVAPEVIDKGVAHWVGTARPGEQGNVVLAGHRTIETRPFHNLDLLETGDLVYLTNGNGFDVMYRVTDTFIVTPKDVWVTYEQGRAMLTMFACHPKGSQRYRIVVQADLVANGRIA